MQAYSSPTPRYSDIYHSATRALHNFIPEIHNKGDTLFVFREDRTNKEIDPYPYNAKKNIKLN